MRGALLRDFVLRSRYTPIPDRHAHYFFAMISLLRSILKRKQEIKKRTGINEHTLEQTSKRNKKRSPLRERARRSAQEVKNLLPRRFFLCSPRPETRYRRRRALTSCDRTIHYLERFRLQIILGSTALLSRCCDVTSNKGSDIERGGQAFAAPSQLLFLPRPLPLLRLLSFYYDRRPHSQQTDETKAHPEN